MRPNIKELFQVQKPALCKAAAVCYCDWGHGLTPKMRDKTVPLLAFAWDRVIQLLYINEDAQTIELDGFYHSQGEVTSLHFVGESVLFALINNCEVKLLYTTKFYPGHFAVLSKDAEKQVSEVVSHAELEKGREVTDVKRSLLQVQQACNLT